jgi:hypothetical protein
LRKRLPNFVSHGLAGKLTRRFFEIAPEFLVTLLAARETDNRHGGRQVAIGRDVVERRDKLAMGEITCSAEDHNATWLRHSARG